MGYSFSFYDEVDFEFLTEGFYYCRYILVIVNQVECVRGRVVGFIGGLGGEVGIEVVYFSCVGCVCSIV